jgi:hypothetical protein
VRGVADVGAGVIDKYVEPTATFERCQSGTSDHPIGPASSVASGISMTMAGSMTADEAILVEERLVGRRSVGGIGPHPARRSRKSARVEHVFAEQKDRMGLFIRTIGIARATTKIGMANLVYNIKRFIFLRKVAVV